ncbi:MAG: metal-dependent transcriptional regulator [Candidatus Lokiarchaeota archaeon]|nr:metal-dependent transcriptional regulator [Candidatus Lokiarchaeota archaeon]MBD3341915.1 metal-dependent transcriptional regulator [Candidatus Lokiarchaeota archaeon]
MVIHESQENYLKAIYLISKCNKDGWVSNSGISEVLSVNPASVTGMLHKLKDKGLINWRPRRLIRLTEEGERIGKQMMKNYEILKGFFIKSLKIDDEKLIEKVCCGIEHHITPEVIKALDNLSS